HGMIFSSVIFSSRIYIRAGGVKNGNAFGKKVFFFSKKVLCYYSEFERSNKPLKLYKCVKLKF
ncbi:MAG: hypothetical protein K2M50_05495, partial [Treponemataceae bacterium]|nr:hypothetical protein [Treponemataceae bacterium]